MHYHIRIKGYLDPFWQDWLYGLTMVHEPAGTTRLAGPLPDQAALFGVLLKIHRLGLILLSLETYEAAEAQEQRRRDADDPDAASSKQTELKTPKGELFIMQARMSNPATILPDVLQPIQVLLKTTRQGGVPQKTLELVHLRVSQINGCSYCVDFGARSAKKAGETDERLFAVAAWRETPYFTDAERAALALAEAATRLADRPDPVSDEIWEEAARHYDEKGLAAIILMIATTNLFNRLNATTRQMAGQGW
ncbi:hypothetical protein KSB_94440 [Ktedonobacter robiniae]|uniref:Carboxymuconolactone decarboxylase-like domain-containing protein n=2 Tax=Ktedonobacter robiniae TaxID=2778365 RepID=A0ABQ3V7U8_9CHLR|nr:carboxymuconolactone decarboxylase family protein [Ktedonobacter robiniae]GHO60969.1 hypothetical protein KSB_94440 [Ktedonobacter robiniae]